MTLRGDFVLLSASFLLLAFGLTMVLCASAGLGPITGQDLYFDRQLLRAGIGLVALVAAYFMPRRWLAPAALIGMGGALVFVVLTLTSVGTGPEGQESQRWLRIFGVFFQPSEILKLALVIHLARILAKRGPRIQTISGLAAPLFIVIGTAAMIAMQPNMGTAATLVIIGIAILFIAGARFHHLLAMGLPVVGAAVLRVLSVPYEKKRLMDWVDSLRDVSGVEYQLRQSLIGLGSGGWLGIGFGESLQKFRFLPAPHTDFIFSILGEEGGFVVSMMVLCIYTLIVFRALRVSARQPDAFGGLLAAGIGIMIGVEVLLNVSVVTGLLPTTGLPLPFLSYGGSSLIVHLAAIGILLRLSRDATPEPESASAERLEPERALRCS